MADPIYEIQQNPPYDTQIRALQDNDPARATTVFNPLMAKLINNTHHVKLKTDTLDTRIEEVAQAAGDAGDASNVTLSNGKSVETAITEIDKQKASLASPALTGKPTAPTPPKATNDTQVATTAFVKEQGYSTLASPAFTGTPTAPTPTKASNNTQLATTAFVKSQDYATRTELQEATEAAAKSGKAYSHTVTAAGWVKGTSTADGSYWQEFRVANPEIIAGDVILVFPGNAAAEAIIKSCVRSYTDTYAGGFKLCANSVPGSNFSILYTINKQEV